MDYKICAGRNNHKPVTKEVLINTLKRSISTSRQIAGKLWQGFSKERPSDKKKQGSLKTTFLANPAVQQAGHRREFISFFTS